MVFLGSWVRSPPSTIIINFSDLPHVELEKYSPWYPREWNGLDIKRSAHISGRPAIPPFQGGRVSLLKSEKFIIVDGGDRTHDPKTHGLSTTPFVKIIRGVLVRLTTCNWLTNSFPKLSLITLVVLVSYWLTFCRWSNRLKPH